MSNGQQSAALPSGLVGVSHRSARHTSTSISLYNNLQAPDGPSTAPCMDPALMERHTAPSSRRRVTAGGGGARIAVLDSENLDTEIYPTAGQVRSRIALRDTWSKRQAGAMRPVRRAGSVWAASCAPAAKKQRELSVRAQARRMSISFSFSVVGSRPSQLLPGTCAAMYSLDDGGASASCPAPKSFCLVPVALLTTP